MLDWTPSRMRIEQALLVFALAFMVAPLVYAGSVRLDWTKVTQKTDGTALTNLAGYVIEYGNLSNNLNQTLTIQNPAATSTTVPNLTSGTTYFFTVRALDAANIVSVPSNQVSAVAADECGAAPATETRQQACPAPQVGSWTQTNAWTSAPAPTCWAANWQPSTPPAGVCADPPLLTAGPYSYCVTGTTAAPTMTSIGYVKAGLSCGPTTRIVGSVKFCRINTESADKVIFCPGDPTLSKGVWSKAQ